MSCADILNAIYFHAKKPEDVFILSKGHAGVALYATLVQAGYLSQDELLKLNQEGLLGEHPDTRIPGVDVSTGSLGQGLGVGCGMALAGNRVFVLMGDGECQEGSVWEAAMFAAHQALDLVVVIDRNDYQVQGSTEEINALEPLADKWRSFGWFVKTCDGHDLEALGMAMMDKCKPLCVIANTIKGKGVSFMEANHDWHHGSLKGEFLEQARRELGTA